MQEPRREHRRRGEAVRAVFLPLPEALHRLILGVPNVGAARPLHDEAARPPGPDGCHSVELRNEDEPDELAARNDLLALQGLLVDCFYSKPGFFWKQYLFYDVVTNRLIVFF